MVKFSLTIFDIEIPLEPFRFCKVFSELEVDDNLKFQFFLVLPIRVNVLNERNAKYLSTLLTTFATKSILFWQQQILPYTYSCHYIRRFTKFGIKVA